MSMNSGPSARIRSIRSKRFCKPYKGRHLSTTKSGEMAVFAYLRGARGKVLERPPDLVGLRSSLYFLGDFHDCEIIFK